MSNDPLSNLGYEDVIDFLEKHECERGAMKGDDVIYYYPKNKSWSIKVNMNPRIRRSGYPKGTLLGNIRQLEKVSGISKKTWRDWFREKRNL